jgi:acyl-coenzyme A thioesterase 9
MLKLKSNVLYRFQNKKFISIFNPNSLLFKHQRELDKLQKQRTRMITPDIAQDTVIEEEMDFEPGIDYLGRDDITMRMTPFVKSNSGCDSFGNRSPADGFIQVQLPFDKDEKLRARYRLLHYERMRYGKLLEILDYLSAFSAYRYNNILPKSKIATMVTAGVDTIELYREVNLNNRLIINSYPTWTGESSMEVRIDMYNGENCSECDESFLGSAFFMYVMRDAKNYKQKMKVASLDLDSLTNKDEKMKAMLRQEIGNENKKLRIKKSQVSLFKSPPTVEESATLHEQFVLFKANKDILVSQTYKGIDAKVCNIKTGGSHLHIRTIQETRIEKSLLMHSQNMNVNGHVFGGYIMREALEIAYVCAYMHGNKENPSVVSVDSVNFHRPVIIGSVAQFIAHVALVHEELVHVCVEVFNFVDTQTSPVLTTTINVTYNTPNKTARVFPTTYECGVKYLEAKRIIEKLFNIF